MNESSSQEKPIRPKVESTLKLKFLRTERSKASIWSLRDASTRTFWA